MSAIPSAAPLGPSLRRVYDERRVWAIPSSAPAAIGLVAAQVYAVAAVATHPDNRKAQELLVELEVLQRQEQQSFVQRSHALAHFDECAADLFDKDMASAASALSLGKKSARWLVTRSLRASLLLFLGHGAEALPIAESVAEAMAAHPDIGPNHPTR